jgi:hypothetical protein
MDPNSRILAAMLDLNYEETKAERLWRRAKSFLLIFFVFFGLGFGFLHFIGPRHKVDALQTNEPMDAIPAAIKAGLVSIIVAAWLSRNA